MAAKLIIQRVDFINALKMLKKCVSPKPEEKAVLSFDDNAFEITVAGMKVSFEAKGEWSGEAQVDGQILLKLHRVFPPGDPVVIQIVDDNLVINNFSMTCTWVDTGWKLPLLPRDPTLRELLIFQYESSDEIKAADLDDKIKQAIIERDKLIKNAVEILSTLGVVESDLLPIVKRSLLRKKD